MRDPFTTRHHPNLPARQQAVQRLADEFNDLTQEASRAAQRMAPLAVREAGAPYQTAKPRRRK